MDRMRNACVSVLMFFIGPKESGLDFMFTLPSRQKERPLPRARGSWWCFPVTRSRDYY
jgi:hypothetical protein